MLAFHLSTFKVDATPPLGHPLCGGWIAPSVGVDDPLWLRGVVLEGGGLPIVLATLDYTGLLNDSHRLWTEAIAEAAHTTPDRVALHCVHQHNAPFVDRGANALLKKAGASPLLYDEAFLDALQQRATAAIREAVAAAVPVTHIQYGQARVREVASNRRILGPDGKVRFVRFSATKDPAIRAEPEGTIDPLLRSISFLRGDQPLARLYYYTTHPMSYYGDGRVTSDFVGIARQKRDAEEPGALHVYFTGCSGNITAGKYNDGSHPNRGVLADRIHRAMAEADEVASRESRPFDSLRWTTAPFRFPPREDLDLGRLDAIVADPKQTTTTRNRDAMTASWLRRVAADRPILLSLLELGGVDVLNLPAETFVEYQLAAQALRAGHPLCVAAYGDGGPWYIPLRRSYDEGGYEPSASWVGRETEPRYSKAIADLLGPAPPRS